MSTGNVLGEPPSSYAFSFALRVATSADIPALRTLIATSARVLSEGFYSEPQIELAATRLFGVDSQLIADGTYYVIEHDSTLVAAGGWSARKTLHGGDEAKLTDDPPISTDDPARIRAFFVHPDWARRGLARMLYARCTRDARAAGFTSFVLVATKPGEPLYTALGFRVLARDSVSIPGSDVRLEVAHMTSEIPAC